MVEFEYRADELVVYENEDEERDMLMIYESAEKGHILMLDERFELKPKQPTREQLNKNHDGV